MAVGDDASKPNEIKNVIKAESSNGEAVEKNGNNFKEDGENKETNKDVTPNENANEASKRKKSHLHKTCSIYFKSIPTTAKVSELENVSFYRFIGLNLRLIFYKAKYCKLKSMPLYFYKLFLSVV